MELIKTNCTECGSPIEISDDAQYIRCPACSTFYAIERSEGYINLKAIEKLTKAIQDTSIGTQDVIRESTQVTRSELQRLQVTQAIAMAEMKLGNLQAEIRGLERGQPTPKSLQQIRNLHGLEFNSMEDLRKMHLNAAELSPQDLNSRIKNAEFHWNWLNNQKRVLSQSDFSTVQKKQNNSDLDTRIGQLVMELFTMRTEQIKANLQTFKSLALPLDDLAQTQIFIQQLNNDEAIVRRMPNSPETQAVLKEISDKRKKVTDAWMQLENKRVSGMLTSPGIAVNQNELASMKNHLALVNGDLNTVKQMPQNSVTKEYVTRLTQEQEALTKQIKKLEKDLQRAEEQARKNALKASVTGQAQLTGSGAVKTGIFAGILLAMTAMFAGIAALGRELIGSISSRKQPAAVNVPVQRIATVGESTQISGANVLQSSDSSAHNALDSLAIPTNENIQASPSRPSIGLQFGALLKGCFLALMLLIAIAIVGAIIGMGAFPDYANTGNSTGIGVMFLGISLGFAFGSIILIRNIAPLTQIKGIGKISDFVINKYPKRSGLSNPLAVKGLIGLVTCIFVYLLFLSIAAFLPTDSALWAVCPGILIGPMMGVIISYQTYLTELQV